ncbi:MAG: hypothetical protein AAFN10_17290, partial [Bacteroidota bacterium]
SKSITMETVFNILLGLHITAGAISLILFWIPVFVKKGKGLHAKVGRFYVYAMWAVVGSAAVLCVLNIFRDRLIMAAFLGVITVLTAHPLWYAIAILKYKREVPVRIINIRRALSWVLFLGSVGITIWSIQLQLQGAAILLLIFGIIGIISSRPAFISVAKAQASANWLLDHLDGMIGTGIAAYTAFLAFGARSMMADLFSEQLMVIPWVLPTIVGTIIIRVMKNRYSPKPKVA